MLRQVIYFFIFLCGCCFAVFPQRPPIVITAKPDFRKLVEQRLGGELSSVCSIDTDSTARRLFTEYGAVFIADKEVTLPFKCIFTSEDDLSRYQAKAQARTMLLDGASITLQAPAMDALLTDREKAAQMGVRIPPRGGALAGGRSYENTRMLWNTRFLPGLDH